MTGIGTLVVFTTPWFTALIVMESLVLEMDGCIDGETFTLNGMLAPFPVVFAGTKVTFATAVGVIVTGKAGPLGTCVATATEICPEPPIWIFCGVKLMFELMVKSTTSNDNVNGAPMVAFVMDVLNVAEAGYVAMGKFKVPFNGKDTVVDVPAAGAAKLAVKGLEHACGLAELQLAVAVIEPVGLALPVLATVKINKVPVSPTCNALAPVYGFKCPVKDASVIK